MKKLLYILLAIVLFASCEKEKSGPDKVIESNSIEFIYKGNVYKSSYQINGESIKWDNPEAGNLYDSLQLLSELSTNILEDGTIELYDNVKELLNAKNLSENKDTSVNKRITTRTHRYGFVAWYEKDGYSGFFNDSFFNTGSSNIVEVPYVGDELNDEITSIRFTVQTNVKPLLVMWEHPNYGGKSISFGGDYSSETMYWGRNINHLRPYKYGGFLGTKTWNDRVSSMKLYANEIWGGLSKVPIYRYYNGEHIFSAKAPQPKTSGTIKVFDGASYRFEYMDFQLLEYSQNYNQDSSQDKTTVSISSYYNNKTRDHMLDIGTGGYGSLPNYGCNEALLGFAYVQQQPGTVPLKEYYSPTDNDYHYVVLKREEKWMQDNIPGRYRYVRTLGYVFLGDRSE